MRMHLSRALTLGLTCSVALAGCSLQEVPNRPDSAAVAAEKKTAFLRSFVGKTVPAITLHASDDDCTETLTDNYLKLHLQGSHPANCWVNARINDVQDDALIGNISA